MASIRKKEFIELDKLQEGLKLVRNYINKPFLFVRNHPEYAKELIKEKIIKDYIPETDQKIVYYKTKPVNHLFTIWLFDKLFEDVIKGG